MEHLASNQEPVSDELFLAPEDFQKLQLLKELALTSARRAKDTLPDRVKNLILNIGVTSKLQENEADQLWITITFKLTHSSNDFQFSLLPQKVFYVNCLDQNLETLVERKFKHECLKLIAGFHKTLSTFAEEINPLGK